MHLPDLQAHVPTVNEQSLYYFFNGEILQFHTFRFS